MPQALRTTGLIPLATDWLKSGTHDPVLAMSNDGKAYLGKFSSILEKDMLKVSVACMH